MTRRTPSLYGQASISSQVCRSLASCRTCSGSWHCSSQTEQTKNNSSVFRIMNAAKDSSSGHGVNAKKSLKK